MGEGPAWDGASMGADQHGAGLARRAGPASGEASTGAGLAWGRASTGEGTTRGATSRGWGHRGGRA